MNKVKKIMGKTLLAVTVLYSVFAICIIPVLAADTSFTISLSKGSNQYTDYIFSSSNRVLAVLDLQYVEGGDDFDVWLQTKIDATWQNISSKKTIAARSATDYQLAFYPIGTSKPEYTASMTCSGTNTSSSSCVLANEKYRVKFYNGSIFGGTASITGMLYSTDL